MKFFNSNAISSVQDLINDSINIKFSLTKRSLHAIKNASSVIAIITSVIILYKKEKKRIKLTMKFKKLKKN